MPLKILLLVHSFSPQTETFIYNDAIALSKKNELIIACFNRRNINSRPHHSVVLLPEYRPNFYAKSIRMIMRRFNQKLVYTQLSIEKNLMSLIAEFQPDIIHCHFGTQALFFIDNIESQCPVFITFHGYDATKAIHSSIAYRKRIQQLFNNPQIYPLATSASLFHFMEKYNIQSSNSTVLYSGIDTDFFRKASSQKKSREKILLQVSSFNKKKGHKYTLEAFKLLLGKYPDTTLILTGGGTAANYIKEQAISIGISDKIIFKGWQNQQQIKFLLESADVFVHPSITTEAYDMESTTVAIMEAMAMELPIFSTVHSGIPELVEHGVNGLLAPEKDIVIYAKYMEELLQWGPQPQNREKIIQHFNHQAHIRQLESLYKAALNVE